MFSFPFVSFFTLNFLSFHYFICLDVINNSLFKWWKKSFSFYFLSSFSFILLTIFAFVCFCFIYAFRLNIIKFIHAKCNIHTQNYKTWGMQFSEMLRLSDDSFFRFFCLVVLKCFFLFCFHFEVLFWLNVVLSVFWLIKHHSQFLFSNYFGSYLNIV